MSSRNEKLLEVDLWRQWCDRLKTVGEQILELNSAEDGCTEGEGIRSLFRLMASATESELEAGRSDFPDFVHDQGPGKQWGGPNPDMVTLRASIDPELSYKIWADVDGMFQATFTQHEGHVALGETHSYYERHLESFELDDDGFLELIVSPESHEGNWIPMHDNARYFTIRIVVSDWEAHTAPTFHIERVGAEGDTPPPLSSTEVARGLERSIDWIESSTVHWPRYARSLSDLRPANVPSAPAIEPGDPSDIATGHCFWELAEDEALLITCEVPIAQYWSFGIRTTTWFDSGDYTRRQTSLSGDQVHVDEDGVARLVLSAQDPGVPNWIDTEARPEGLLVYRFGWAETLPTPDIRRVPVEGIFDLLPDDHPVVNDADRREQLSLRREALWNRFG